MFIYREVEQLVARQAHNLEVACSSPALATKLNDNNLKHRLLFFLFKKTGYDFHVYLRKWYPDFGFMRNRLLLRV